MNEQTFRNFRLERDLRGVMTAILNVPDRPVNVFDESVIRELYALVERFEQDQTIKLIVFKSDKPSGFLAGADVAGIQSLKSAAEAEEISKLGQDLFTRIEKLPVPTVAVIHGPCLGGGLEFALACKYRIACNDSRTRLGLPEVELGLLPGWGGTQRLPRLIGLASALRVILEGKKFSAQDALKVGLVNLAPVPEKLDSEVARFLADLLAGRTPKSRPAPLSDRLRDRSSFGQWLVFRTVRAKLKNHAKHYPALNAALGAIERGLKHPGEAGYAAERKAFGQLLFTPACRSLIELFFQRERARSTAAWVRPESETTPSPPKIQRVAVIGGGVMGAGIAQLAASQGLEVVLKEINQELVDAGMARIRGPIDDMVKRGSLTADEAAKQLGAISPSVAWDPVQTADLAIEAVTEKEQIKLQVFRELDSRLPKPAIISSNTSALSIQHLAEATGRPAQVGGLHFFNPVHRMQLVEVVRAAATSDETVASLVGLVRTLGKTPVVVSDSPGFLVNRILFPYLTEGVRLVCEGYPVEQVDREMKKFGMPMGPLELIDQAGLDIAVDVAKTLATFTSDLGPATERLTGMVARGWLGKKSGRGFYEYEKDKRGKPTEWETNDAKPARERVRKNGALINDLSPIQQRLVSLLINESARCLGEQIVSEPWMVDLAMVLGTGFAPFRGGPLRTADAFGIPALVQLLERLSAAHGDRFSPSATLRKMSEGGAQFYPAPRENHVAGAKAGLKAI